MSKCYDHYPTWMEMVREFHEKFGHPINDTLHIDDEWDTHLRRRLITEELLELMDATSDRNAVEMADALGDLIYVICGAALAWGIDLDAVVREIHRSNLTKLFEDGPRYREDGKILKGPSYTPPNIAPLLHIGRRAA